MAVASHSIDVYALLPDKVATGPELDVNPTNWRWVHCLTLPLDTLNTLQFSRRLYPWIRYAIGVVVGAEGVLSTTPDSLSAVDEDNIPPTESVKLYYHISDEEKRRTFPVNPHIANSHVTSSAPSTRRDDFRDEVAKRDGGRCVLTGLGTIYCTAVHLLSQSKGDMYISTYTQRRSRDPNDIIHDIDSLRNGLFLNNLAHPVLGKDLAFIITPNFAMNTTDIDPDASPTEMRCTSHLFLHDPSLHQFSSGERLRISDTLEYPPAILFDAVYAGAVLRHFGTQALKDKIIATWKDALYNDGIMTAADAEQTKINHERAVAKERKQNQDQACDRRHKARNPDTFDMVMTLPYIMVPKTELQGMLREAKEKAEAAEQNRVREKVDTWMRQVTPE